MHWYYGGVQYVSTAKLGNYNNDMASHNLMEQEKQFAFLKYSTLCFNVT
ncbi:hypothetical protein VCHA37P191_160021 [Vibrio chagasii]|nr:hypothetical protein VCHA37P191_160021 [Vibrio chagasii]CAH7128136.1 hypothetical protein VCHA34P112_90109 [Vibrio chagasii]CAH7415828.1 hypothetical protein VCHA57P511_20101 [Vibrio chagasii]CAH7432197.1 hypothetical protein VCHA56P515_90083 [Vibrio chagasii]CAH7448881.1 hypothetical protein VCHA53O463_80110 [Vibrio chagasii]